MRSVPGSYLALALPLLLALGCKPVDYDPGTGAGTTVSLPADATVSSLQVIPGEVREGMRRVKVRAKKEDGGEVVITEWVPVVLLGRLAVGRTVQLIRDPVEKDRITFSL